MPPANHPLWSTIRLIVVMICLTTTLYLNAQHFDETELRTITWMFFAAGGIEILPNLLGKKA